MSDFPHHLRDPKTIVCLLLAGIVLVAYSGVWNYPFIHLDDDIYVTSNSRVQQGLSWDNFKWSLTTLKTASNWHPVTWLSHMLDYQLYGLSAGGHHLTNLIFHLTNALLLFAVLQQMTGAVWRSALVAALFGLHPLNVESVAWVAERKNVLSTLFWLLTLWAYLGYVRKPEWKRYLGMMGLLVLGLMTKQMLVTLPCVLLLLDYWPLDRLGRDWRVFRERLPRLVVEKLPLFLPVGVASVLTILAARTGGSAIATFEVLPVSARLENALVAYADYLKKMVWPTDLAVFYPHPGTSISLGPAVVAGLLLVTISIGIFWTVRKFPYLAVGWLWFLGTLLPVSGFVQAGGQSMADRFTYVPFIGLFIALVWGSAEWLDRSQVGKRRRIAACVCLLAALLVSTRLQLSYWRDSITLFGHAIRVTEGNFLAQYGLGTAFLDGGKIEDALAQFSAALHIKPKEPNGLYNMGVALKRNGNSQAASWYFSKALEINPSMAIAHNQLGTILLTQGRLEKAINHFLKAVENNSQLVTANNNLGAALMEQGKFEEAIEWYSRAIRLAPNNARIHDNLGIALVQAGKVNQAAQHFSEAIKLDPTYLQAQENLNRLQSR
jgi:Flp pilus assembly protein TadD